MLILWLSFAIAFLDQATKYLVQQSLFLNLEQSLRLSRPAQNLARSTEDHREGVRAFLEKRRPEFKGR